MSQRTRTKSASPPIRSGVSSDPASFRPRLGRAFLTVCFVVRSRTGFFVAVSRFRTCRRSGCVGAGGCTCAGADGVLTTCDGAGAGAAGGGGACVVAGRLGWGVAPGAGSGLGVCERGGPGSGAGPWARAGAVNDAPTQNRRRRTEVCRNNDLPERLMEQSPPGCFYRLFSRSVSPCQWRGGLDLRRVAQIQHARKPTYARPRPRAIRNISVRSSCFDAAN